MPFGSLGSLASVLYKKKSRIKKPQTNAYHMYQNGFKLSFGFPPFNTTTCFLSISTPLFFQLFMFYVFLSL